MESGEWRRCCWNSFPDWIGCGPEPKKLNEKEKKTVQNPKRRTNMGFVMLTIKIMEWDPDWDLEPVSKFKLETFCFIEKRFPYYYKMIICNTNIPSLQLPISTSLDWNRLDWKLGKNWNVFKIVFSHSE